MAYATTRRPAAGAADRPGAAQGEQVEPPDVLFVPWGPSAGFELVATYGDPESEYAALRKGAGIFDAAHRGTLRITGDDRRDFLDRMLTQKLADLGPGRCRETFWLNRKGRIDADLLLVELGDRMLADTDVHAVAGACESLDGFIFAEDVELTDVTDEMHRIGVYGPEAARVVGLASGSEFDLAPLTATTVDIAGAVVVVARRDLTGQTGLELIVPRVSAEAVWDTLLARDDGTRRVRPVGWFALNIARIEAGTPLFNIDFGSSNLPHETGLVGQRVSFDKGCYLGQEIVARTENLGKPKQRLMGLRPRLDKLPEAGAAVFAADDDSKPIGVVTSSTLSPMLGAVPIALAMVRTAAVEGGGDVTVEAEGEHVTAGVTDMAFWSAGS